MTDKAFRRRRLIIFGRYPSPGKTKTRLIPTLGEVGAARLQRRLTEHTVSVARRSLNRSGGRLLFCHDGASTEQMHRWLGSRDIDYVPQAAGDLGRRMCRAIKTAFHQGSRRVVLIGTDIPGLMPQTLDRAWDALERSRLVLGPSTDGGYWLVGMTALINIFEGIAWGTGDVLAQTLSQARRHGIETMLLDPLSDLDRPEDLSLISDRRSWSTPYLSVIIPTLNEAQHLLETISTAVSADTEILVSDGGSSDTTRKIAGSLGARIICGQPGRAGQQNRGAAVAGGEVLLFLHADTRLPDNYANHIFEIMMDRGTILGAFQFQTDLNTSAMRWIAALTNLRAKWFKLPYGDQGLFVRKADFERTGGFPDVAIAEDLYWVRRMARFGRVTIAPAAAVTSGRRWQALGPTRTTMTNTIIALGCLAGIAPQRLAPLYRLPVKKGPP